MRTDGTINPQAYTKVQYTQFKQSKILIFFRELFIYLVIPFIYPLTLLSKMSDYFFRTTSEALSLIPFLFGVIIREAYYRTVLKSCGHNLVVSLGTVFHYQDISVGENVLIGIHSTVHHCDIGNDVLIGDGCRLLSGSRQHDFNRVDIPIAMQNGLMKKIRIGNDVWIGSNSVVMEDIEDGCIIGSGSVVNKRMGRYSIVAGNPARVLRKRM